MKGESKMKSGALIIAGGLTNQDRELDPLRQIGSTSALQRLCMTFQLAGVKTVAVVIPNSIRHSLEKHLAKMRIMFIVHTSPDGEMIDFIKQGLTQLKDNCDRILITPANVPLFSIETVQKLLSCKGDLAIPVHWGRRGHPIMAHKKIFGSIIGYVGDNGLSGALRQLGEPPTIIEVEDAGIYVRSNQNEQCTEISSNHSLHQWRPVLKLRIARESIFFGPGAWQLMTLISQSESVRVASEQMGISYSKAWRILNTLEEQTGYPVIFRQKGGKGGGKSLLTEKGIALMNWYESFEKLCVDKTDQLFAENPPPK